MIDSVKFWIENAPTRLRGKHAKWRTARSDQLEHFLRAETFDGARMIGLRHQDALKLAAEWHHVDEETIRDSCKKVFANGNASWTYFLSKSCQLSLDPRRNDLDAPPDKRRSEALRWIALLKKYESRRPSAEFRAFDRGKL